MSDRLFSRMFFLAALWNFVAALGGLFRYEAQFRLLFGEEGYTGDFHQALLYRSFAIAVLLFGIGYYLVSRDTSQNRGIVWLGAAGKVMVFVFFTEAILKDKATMIGWGVSFGDLLWALLFFWFLYRTKDRVRVSNLIG
ncbi:MAG: hypothetical protein JSU89_12475 [Myxococcales bacterium]|nr:MAG: hypothetical protein JSU89_12475 [Myxococcales bacterium]